MNPMASEQFDHFARIADKVIDIGLAVALVVFVPPEIRRRMKDGRVTRAKGRFHLMLAWLIASVVILYALYDIFEIVYGSRA